jgi:molecular chaperone DnaJ
MGRGTLFDTPCPVCHGTGQEHKVRAVKVRIPAGVEDGQRIRVKGRGAPGQGMAPAGDLYVVVHVAKHEVFGRSGRNLTITVPITYPEAALGTTITVPTLDGKVTLKVPAGTQSGRVLRVRGRGVPGGSGRNGKKPGDLLVKVEVVVPTELTDEQKAALESLAAVTEPAPRIAVDG